jgi:hypothetical protein
MADGQPNTSSEMKKCPLDTTIGLVEAATSLEVNAGEFLPKIKVPTLLLTGAEYTSLITVEEANQFRVLISRPKAVALPGVKAAVVSAVPARCVEEVLRFIEEQIEV